VPLSAFVAPEFSVAPMWLGIHQKQVSTLSLSLLTLVQVVEAAAKVVTPVTVVLVVAPEVFANNGSYGVKYTIL
jgi:hypothetical protein